MIRVTYKPHAYCVGSDSEPDREPCGFELQGGHFGLTTAEIRNEAQRHVQRTGHTVFVDIVDRTDYAPEPSVGG